MTMVERVAKALYEKLDANQESFVSGDPSDGYEMTTIDGRWNLRDIARAAMEAMREPSEAMADNLFAVDNVYGEEAMLDLWRTTIDAALKEKAAALSAGGIPSTSG